MILSFLDFPPDEGDAVWIVHVSANLLKSRESEPCDETGHILEFEIGLQV
jgi:hypothetical protein